MIIKTKEMGKVSYNDGESAAIVPADLYVNGLDTGLLIDITDTPYGTEEFRDKFPVGSFVIINMTTEIEPIPDPDPYENEDWHSIVHSTEFIRADLRSRQPSPPTKHRRPLS